MKRVYLLGCLLAMAAGSLSANPALTLSCSLNVTGLPGPFSGLGSVDGNGCFSTSFSTVPSLLSVNWGAPVTSGGLGAALLSTDHPPVVVTTPVPAAAKLTNGDPVTVTSTAGSITRVDDFAYKYTGTGWNSPSIVGLANFAGHFTSASASSPSSPDDALIEVTSGSMGISLLGHASPSVYGIWFEIASLGGTNSTFTASVQAFDSLGTPLGIYSLTEFPGTANYGSGGQCPGLATKDSITQLPTPAPCNDAPYVGFYDPQGRISSVYITVFSGGAPVGFAIDSLFVDEVQGVPEPAIPLLIGGGLAAMALYRRKRHARVG